ncbi:hypothetical protein EDD85DRAFT_163895 [Armillaria nabsnona]|nr:hypothetical protein EDD85DRAFT_163895 [Armillaria nabsnona]
MNIHPHQLLCTFAFCSVHMQMSLNAGVFNSSFETTGSLTTDGISTTISTPSSTPNNSNSHKTKQMSTIIGAVIGVVVFSLLLALGVVHYYRVHRNRRHMLLPGPKVILQYLQIRPSSQHGAIHKLRGRDVPVPASVDRLRPTSINSGVVDFDVEEKRSPRNQSARER